MMSSAGLPPGTYQLLVYDYVPDILERRDPYRAAHLEHAERARAAGRLLNLGAVGSPPSGAIFVFSSDASQEEIEAYAARDAYVAAGLVPAHRVEPWTVVV
jgi:uncharacterized protein YciI